MTDTSKADPPPQTNGIEEDVDEDERGKMRPADIDADMREMERRKRVEMIMNSRLFKEELERIIEIQMKEGGNGHAGLLQQISDIMGGRIHPSGMFKSSNCVVPINDIRGVESMGYAKGEKILRCKLAAVYRLIDLYGWAQGINNLITARLNQEEEHFLANPHGMLFHELTASSLVKLDMQGNVVESGTTNFPVNSAAFQLHAAVHAARPDIKCVIHIHTPSILAVSSFTKGLLPISPEAISIGEVSYHPYFTVVDAEEKEQIGRSLGPINKVLFLANKGALCCGETIEEAFFNVYNTSVAAETQLKLGPSVNLENVHVIPEEARTSGSTKSAALQFEALMRMLDNAGFRTGYIYRQPLVKGELPRPRNDVEVPPAVSSLGYLLEEEELYKQGQWKRYADGKKSFDRTRWLNSPNVYQKVEILETGTPDPKKITKWVDANAEEWVVDGSPTHSSTPVKIDSALQFVPKNTNPKEFKKLQKQIKENRRADKITSGPQSHILEGVSWEEAKKLQDANVSETGDQVIVVGAASKGIIQREFQHHATVYKTPYARNPFDTITDQELEDYKKVVTSKQKGEFSYDDSESEGFSSSAALPPTGRGFVSETEDESRGEARVLRIETIQVPRASKAEVVLSDACNLAPQNFGNGTSVWLSPQQKDNKEELIGTDVVKMYCTPCKNSPPTLISLPRENEEAVKDNKDVIVDNYSKSMSYKIHLELSQRFSDFSGKKKHLHLNKSSSPEEHKKVILGDFCENDSLNKGLDTSVINTNSKLNIPKDCSKLDNLCTIPSSASFEFLPDFELKSSSDKNLSFASFIAFSDLEKEDENKVMSNQSVFEKIAEGEATHKDREITDSMFESNCPLCNKWCDSPSKGLSPCLYSAVELSGSPKVKCSSCNDVGKSVKNIICDLEVSLDSVESFKSTPVSSDNEDVEIQECIKPSSYLDSSYLNYNIFDNESDFQVIKSKCTTIARSLSPLPLLTSKVPKLSTITEESNSEEDKYCNKNYTVVKNYLDEREEQSSAEGSICSPVSPPNCDVCSDDSPDMNDYFENTLHFKSSDECSISSSSHGALHSVSHHNSNETRKMTSGPSSNDGLDAKPAEQVLYSVSKSREISCKNMDRESSHGLHSERCETREDAEKIPCFWHCDRNSDMHISCHESDERSVGNSSEEDALLYECVCSRSSCYCNSSISAEKTCSCLKCSSVNCFQCQNKSPRGGSDPVSNYKKSDHHISRRIRSHPSNIDGWKQAKELNQTCCLESGNSAPIKVLYEKGITTEETSVPCFECIQDPKAKEEENFALFHNDSSEYVLLSNLNGSGAAKNPDSNDCKISNGDSNLKKTELVFKRECSPEDPSKNVLADAVNKKDLKNNTESFSMSVEVIYEQMEKQESSCFRESEDANSKYHLSSVSTTSSKSSINTDADMSNKSSSYGKFPYCDCKALHNKCICVKSESEVENLSLDDNAESSFNKISGNPENLKEGCGCKVLYNASNCVKSESEADNLSLDSCDESNLKADSEKLLTLSTSVEIIYEKGSLDSADIQDNEVILNKLNKTKEKIEATLDASSLLRTEGIVPSEVGAAKSSKYLFTAQSSFLTDLDESYLTCESNVSVITDTNSAERKLLQTCPISSEQVNDSVQNLIPGQVASFDGDMIDDRCPNLICDMGSDVTSTIALNTSHVCVSKEPSLTNSMNQYKTSVSNGNEYKTVFFNEDFDQKPVISNQQNSSVFIDQKMKHGRKDDLNEKELAQSVSLVFAGNDSSSRKFSSHSNSLNQTGMINIDNFNELKNVQDLTDNYFSHSTENDEKVISTCLSSHIAQNNAPSHVEMELVEGIQYESIDSDLSHEKIKFCKSHCDLAEAYDINSSGYKIHHDKTNSLSVTDSNHQTKCVPNINEESMQTINLNSTNEEIVSNNSDYLSPDSLSIGVSVTEVTDYPLPSDSNTSYDSGSDISVKIIDDDLTQQKNEIECYDISSNSSTDEFVEETKELELSKGSLPTSTTNNISMYSVGSSDNDHETSAEALECNFINALVPSDLQDHFPVKEPCDSAEGVPPVDVFEINSPSYGIIALESMQISNEPFHEKVLNSGDSDSFKVLKYPVPPENNNLRITEQELSESLIENTEYYSQTSASDVSVGNENFDFSEPTSSIKIDEAKRTSSIKTDTVNFFSDYINDCHNKMAIALDSICPSNFTLNLSKVENDECKAPNSSAKLENVTDSLFFSSQLCALTESSGNLNEEVEKKQGLSSHVSGELEIDNNLVLYENIEALSENLIVCCEPKEITDTKEDSEIDEWEQKEEIDIDSNRILIGRSNVNSDVRDAILESSLNESLKVNNFVETKREILSTSTSIVLNLNSISQKVKFNDNIEEVLGAANLDDAIVTEESKIVIGELEKTTSSVKQEIPCLILNSKVEESKSDSSQETQESKDSFAGCSNLKIDSGADCVETKNSFLSKFFGDSNLDPNLCKAVKETSLSVKKEKPIDLVLNIKTKEDEQDIKAIRPVQESQVFFGMMQETLENVQESQVCFGMMQETKFCPETVENVIGLSGSSVAKRSFDSIQNVMIDEVFSDFKQNTEEESDTLMKRHFVKTEMASAVNDTVAVKVNEIKSNVCEVQEFNCSKTTFDFCVDMNELESTGNPVKNTNEDIKSEELMCNAYDLESISEPVMPVDACITEVIGLIKDINCVEDFHVVSSQDIVNSCNKIISESTNPASIIESCNFFQCLNNIGAMSEDTKEDVLRSSKSSNFTDDYIDTLSQESFFNDVESYYKDVELLQELNDPSTIEVKPNEMKIFQFNVHHDKKRAVKETNNSCNERINFDPCKEKDSATFEKDDSDFKKNEQNIAKVETCENLGMSCNTRLLETQNPTERTQEQCGENKLQTNSETFDHHLDDDYYEPSIPTADKATSIRSSLLNNSDCGKEINRTSSFISTFSKLSGEMHSCISDFDDMNTCFSVPDVPNASNPKFYLDSQLEESENQENWFNTESKIVENSSDSSIQALQKEDLEKVRSLTSDKSENVSVLKLVDGSSPPCVKIKEQDTYPIFIEVPGKRVKSSKDQRSTERCGAHKSDQVSNLNDYLPEKEGPKNLENSSSDYESCEVKKQEMKPEKLSDQPVTGLCGGLSENYKISGKSSSENGRKNCLKDERNSFDSNNSSAGGSKKSTGRSASKATVKFNDSCFIDTAVVTRDDASEISKDDKRKDALDDHTRSKSSRESSKESEFSADSYDESLCEEKSTRSDCFNADSSESGCSEMTITLAKNYARLEEKKEAKKLEQLKSKATFSHDEKVILSGLNPELVPQHNIKVNFSGTVESTEPGNNDIKGNESPLKVNNDINTEYEKKPGSYSFKDAACDVWLEFCDGLGTKNEHCHSNHQLTIDSNNISNLPDVQIEKFDEETESYKAENFIFYGIMDNLTDSKKFQSDSNQNQESYKEICKDVSSIKCEENPGSVTAVSNKRDESKEAPPSNTQSKHENLSDENPKPGILKKIISVSSSLLAACKSDDKQSKITVEQLKSRDETSQNSTIKDNPQPPNEESPKAEINSTSHLMENKEDQKFEVNRKDDIRVDNLPIQTSSISCKLDVIVFNKENEKAKIESSDEKSCKTENVQSAIIDVVAIDPSTTNLAVEENKSRTLKEPNLFLQPKKGSALKGKSEEITGDQVMTEHETPLKRRTDSETPLIKVTKDSETPFIKVTTENKNPPVEVRTEPEISAVKIYRKDRSLISNERSKPEFSASERVTQGERPIIKVGTKSNMFLGKKKTVQEKPFAAVKLPAKYPPNLTRSKSVDELFSIDTGTDEQFSSDLSFSQDSFEGSQESQGSSYGTTDTNDTASTHSLGSFFMKDPLGRYQIKRKPLRSLPYEKRSLSQRTSAFSKAVKELPYNVLFNKEAPAPISIPHTCFMEYDDNSETYLSLESESLDQSAENASVHSDLSEVWNTPPTSSAAEESDSSFSYSLNLDWVLGDDRLSNPSQLKRLKTIKTVTSGNETVQPKGGNLSVNPLSPINKGSHKLKSTNYNKRKCSKPAQSSDFQADSFSELSPQSIASSEMQSCYSALSGFSSESKRPGILKKFDQATKYIVGTPFYFAKPHGIFDKLNRKKSDNFRKPIGEIKSKGEKAEPLLSNAPSATQPTLSSEDKICSLTKDEIFQELEKNEKQILQKLEKTLCKTLQKHRNNDPGMNKPERRGEKNLRCLKGKGAVTKHTQKSQGRPLKKEKKDDRTLAVRKEGVGKEYLAPLSSAAPLKSFALLEHKIIPLSEENKFTLTFSDDMILKGDKFKISLPAKPEPSIECEPSVVVESSCDSLSDISSSLEEYRNLEFDCVLTEVTDPLKKLNPDETFPKKKDSKK